MQWLLLITALFLIIGCSDDTGGDEFEITVDPENSTYWDSVCNEIINNEYLICYGFVTNKYKTYDDSNILYYMLEIQKYYELHEAHLVLYQLELKPEEYLEIDRTHLLNDPYSVNLAAENIVVLDKVEHLKTKISFEQIIQNFENFPKEKSN